jgi:hypothetical protein
MLGTKKKTVDEMLVTLLAVRPYSKGPALVSAVATARRGVTKQAVYAALRSLRVLGVVGKNKEGYFLNTVWMSKVVSMFDSVAQSALDPVLSLNLRSRVSYTFTDLITCDQYWSHIFSVLFAQLPAGRGVFVWNPHEWFVLGNESVERSVFASMEKSNKKAFYSIGGSTQLDIKFKQGWENKAVSISVGSGDVFAETKYINVFDEYVIEVTIPADMAKNIEKFYVRGADDEKARQEFKRIVSNRGTVRMVIERNIDKAAKLRKKIGADFLVPEECR